MRVLWTSARDLRWSWRHYRETVIWQSRLRLAPVHAEFLQRPVPHCVVHSSIVWQFKTCSVKLRASMPPLREVLQRHSCDVFRCRNSIILVKDIHVPTYTLSATQASTPSHAQTKTPIHNIIGASVWTTHQPSHVHICVNYTHLHSHVHHRAFRSPPPPVTKVPACPV